MRKNFNGERDIARPIFPHNHSPEYLMHKFWSRKPHNIIAVYIANYSNAGDIVLDPFGGSGVTANEALHLGRRAISIDANELATFIARSTIAPVDSGAFECAANALVERVKPTIEDLYTTICPTCKKHAQITHVLWRDVILCPCGEIMAVPANVRERDATLACPACNKKVIASDNRIARPYSIYYQCPSCKGGVKGPDAMDLDLDRVERESPAYHQVLVDLPSLDTPLVYPNGQQFQQLRHGMRKDPRLRNLFTARNLIAIHAFWTAINGITASNGDEMAIKDMLRFTFSSMLPQASKMVWIIKQRAKQSLKKSEVGSWTHHFFWNPTEYFEVNVINGFGERVAKVVNGLRAKAAWNDGSQKWCMVAVEDDRVWWLSKLESLPPAVRVIERYVPGHYAAADDARQFFTDPGKTVLFQTTPSQQLQGIPAESIDYIFADPPYGDSIQYAELSAFFLAWFHPRDMQARVQQAFDAEITINPGQAKDFTAYKAMLGEVFAECHRVLKQGKCMTLTFHDTDARVRSLLYDAMLGVGFSFQQATYQPPPRPSEKSLLHEFGSPTGDYMITFKKESVAKPGLRAVDDNHKVLKEALDAIFARRGEPVPFNYLLSLLDLQLVEMGYRPPDMHKSLESFMRAEPYYAWTQTKGWYFTDEVARSMHVDAPLQGRIDNELRRILPSLRSLKGNVLEEAAINAVFAKFNGVLTPALKSLKKQVSANLKAPAHS
nr:DNA methyltransferase [Candidatus Sigynarchaeota archaeon]